jgi:hypothetical protein
MLSHSNSDPLLAYTACRPLRLIQSLSSRAALEGEQSELDVSERYARWNPCQVAIMQSSLAVDEEMDDPLRWLLH